MIKEGTQNLKIIDSPLSFPLFQEPPYTYYQKERLPNAQFIDLDLFTDLNNDLPHMLPTLEDFSKFMSILKICKNSNIVLYDDFGVCGAARMWWVFKCFGIDVNVLDGGLKAWKSSGFEVETNVLNEDQIWSRGGWGFNGGKDGPGKTKVF